MNKKFTISLALTAVGLMCFLIFYWVEYEKEVEIENIKKFLDFQTQILNKNIEEEKLSAMTVAVLLSESESIKNCFLEDNRTHCMDVLHDFAHTLSQVPIYKNVKFHLHTPELKSFARSWIPMYNDNLSSFRFMLKEAKKGVVAGIEIGRAGALIRSVAPVLKDNKNLGSVEVLLDFGHLSNFFVDQGVDLFVLLDKSPNSPYQNEDKEDPIKGYHLINKEYADLNILPILKDIDFKTNQFYKFDSHNFAIKPMLDSQGKRIGYFVIYFNSNQKERNLSKLNIWFKN
ncbi:cache domain-containing protein [Campylobacter sp.]|uniref:cache domain-containing protein n=1 Tax=Campylobacter sp. TaxID=205 RepID=UPI0026FB81AD|nr:cache domain-containing protein [Campylobacter sp.]